MRVEYCDRCGTRGGTKAERMSGKVPKVVRVTFSPLSRVVDLCGACRRDLDAALDRFVAEGRTATEQPRTCIHETPLGGSSWCYVCDAPWEDADG